LDALQAECVVFGALLDRDVAAAGATSAYDSADDNA